jgi:hypothetical protein
VAHYTLAQAISQFVAGESLAQHVVAGLPVVWVGRAGKLLQFLAAWAVVVEIIGVAELRSTLSQLRLSAYRDYEPPSRAFGDGSSFCLPSTLASRGAPKRRGN